MKNNKKKGFTLVELLVVIAILAILASVTVVGYMGFTTKAKESVALQEAEQAETALFGELVDGVIETTDFAEALNYKYTFVDGSLVAVYDSENVTEAKIQEDLIKITGLTGTFDIASDKNNATAIDGGASYTIPSITYNGAQIYEFGTEHPITK